MNDKQNNYKDNFIISSKDLIWSTKLFFLSICFAFFVSITVYILMLTYSQPEPVNQAIVSTASAATAKVTVTSNYVNPMWSIFFFNSIAAFFAVIGTGVFMVFHKILINDIAIREKYSFYTRSSILFEKMVMPFFRVLIKIAMIADRDLSAVNFKDYSDNDSIWNSCGYDKKEYIIMAYMLPFTIPLMVIVVNGLLAGILLAFFTFDGAMTGYLLLDITGIIIGVLYNITYFMLLILPHGIIELPAIIIAASLGYRFAYIQAHDVIDKKLFSGNDIKSLRQDAAYTLVLTKKYILSAYIWKMLTIVIFMLLVAAYIETYITLEMANSTMIAINEILIHLIAE